MNTDVLHFFAKNMAALPLYEAFADKVQAEIENVRIKVQKSQISFHNRHMFACVSLARVRKKQDCPPAYIVVTFGLAHKLTADRIEIATEPYPNRWTHHVLIADAAEIDAELLGWVKEAAVFSDLK